MDITEALTKSSNPRYYCDALKRRKNELSTDCLQLILGAAYIFLQFDVFMIKKQSKQMFIFS